MWEFRQALTQAGEDVIWLEGHCITFGPSIPFLPLIEQLRANFGIEEFDGEPEIIAKVEHSMRRMRELEAHIPWIRYLLSVEPGDPAIAAIKAVVRRKHIFDALRALALRGATRWPLVLLMEDLHWIDRNTEEFLASLIDAVATVPLLLLLSYRVGYMPPFGSWSFYATLTLQRLSEAEALAVVGGVLGTARGPKELQPSLMARAEGAPLVIEELVKTLRDLGILQQENSDYRMARGLTDVWVPDTIQGIIMARLDCLAEEAKRTVQLASVIGRQFPVRLLARVAERTDRLAGLLRDLETIDIIDELGVRPEPTYSF